MENEKLATEIISELKGKLYDVENMIDGCNNHLESVVMALSMIKDEYEWAHIPDVNEAYKYHNTAAPGINCTEDEYRSWLFIAGYKEIMFLINVAFDYCFKAKEEIS